VRRWWPAALAAWLLTASGCSDGAAREAAPFEGVWQSDAFGSFVVVEGGSLQVLEYTSVSCAPLVDSTARGISDIASIVDDRLVVRDSGRIVTYDSIDALPATCDEDFISDNPRRTVEVVIATFDEHYAFLEERAPDWESMRAAASAAVTETSTAAELFEVLTALLGSLGDAQVRLAVDDPDVGSVWPSESADPLAARLREEITAGTFLQPGSETRGDGGIVVGRTPAGAGYLALTRLVGFDDTTDEGIDELASAIDELLAGLEGAPGLVIDLRGNRGGLELFAPVVASRFLDSERVVARRTARVAGTDEFVPSGEVTVTPMPTGTYRGPVVVLVGPATAGAAELLVLALRTQDGVTLVGEPTAGSLSPILPRALPNNWIVGISNQRVYDSDGALWEVAGIPPDETVPLTIADLDGAEDPVLARADDILRG
jgi:hypothetical protein